MKAQTLIELKESGYKPLSVKDEIRKNLIEKIKKGEELFPGIVGYDNTVIPGIVNALLSKHNFILLGLRGQAKSRLLRNLVNFLDEYIPAIKGSPVNESPFNPLSKYGRKILEEKGDNTPIEWLHRSLRYNEKLATPDVSMADIIGDLDPIKAATRKLTYSDEEVIHFGIIPRTNRGIFAINELPDLQPRIQVGLLNLLEEGDIQIRGFPLRMPLDIMFVFSANPEDYTNRGNIITPLKDRIDSEIITHYPVNIKDAIRITEQEAWTERDMDSRIVIPDYFKELVEEIGFEARRSEFVYQNSGVSARLSISAMENLISNMEKRALTTKELSVYPRICDLGALIPSITGKLELVYEGEQEGSQSVAKRLMGSAIKKVFKKFFPKATTGYEKKMDFKKPEVESTYKNIIEWFSDGKKLDISDDMEWKEYFHTLMKVPKLFELSQKYMPSRDKYEIALGMEIILEGLHQNSLLAKESFDTKSSYYDMLKVMFDQMRGFHEI